VINHLNKLSSNKTVVDGKASSGRIDCQSGIERSQQGLTSESDEAKIAALSQALKYGRAGRQWLFQIVKNESGPVQWAAFDLLWVSVNEKARQKLLQYRPWRSEVGIDYTRLRNLLAAGQWEQADAMTKELMLKVTGREKEGLLDRNSSENFPCEDLCTIDRLWVRYSKGRFGFSVQERILESLLENQNAQKGSSEHPEFEVSLRDSVNQLGNSIRDNFAAKVGWRRNGEWLHPHELTFNLSAPEGHLPSPMIATPYDPKGGGEQACKETIGKWCGACCFGSVWCGVLFLGWWYILYRLKGCPCRRPITSQ